MTTPHTPPAAPDVAAIRDLMSADEARSLLAAMTPGTLEVTEIRDGRLIDAAAQELAVVIHDDARAHQKPDGTWHSVIVCRGMDGPTRDANAAAFAAVKRALATVATLVAQAALLRGEVDELQAKAENLTGDYEAGCGEARRLSNELARLTAQHAADVAAAVAGERERIAAECKRVVRENTRPWELAEELADALAAPTGGGE